MFVLQTTRCWYLGMGCLDWNGGMERSTYKLVIMFCLSDYQIWVLRNWVSQSLDWNMNRNGGMDYGMDYGVLFTVDGTTSFFCLFPLHQTTYTAIKCLLTIPFVIRMSCKVQLKLLQGLGNLLRVQIVCTAVHMAGIFVRERCPFAVFSTYLMSKQSSQPL